MDLACGHRYRYLRFRKGGLAMRAFLGPVNDDLIWLFAPLKGLSRMPFCPPGALPLGRRWL